MSWLHKCEHLHANTPCRHNKAIMHECMLWWKPVRFLMVGKLGRTSYIITSFHCWYSPVFKFDNQIRSAVCLKRLHINQTQGRCLYLVQVLCVTLYILQSSWASVYQQQRQQPSPEMWMKAWGLWACHHRTASYRNDGCITTHKSCQSPELSFPSLSTGISCLPEGFS